MSLSDSSTDGIQRIFMIDLQEINAIILIVYKVMTTFWTELLKFCLKKLC